jgi:hypothetical protein
VVASSGDRVGPRGNIFLPARPYDSNKFIPPNFTPPARVSFEPHGHMFAEAPVPTAWLFRQH